MPFKLIPPGTRKGNPYWLIRGTNPVNGRDLEVSTKARDKAAARRFATELEHKLIKNGPPKPGDAITFGTAARLYAEFRGLDLDVAQHPDAKRINRLIAELGAVMLADINHTRLVTAANKLCPDFTPATKNREVMRMAAAVLHYAAENDYCEWLRIKLFPEPEPETRAVSLHTARAVITSVGDGARPWRAGSNIETRRFLLLWMFRQGTRITQTLSVTWNEISLWEQTFRLYDKKAKKWQTFPLHADVFQALCEISEEQRVGRLWPWTQKTGVYRWLRPMVRQLGIEFTPHMARHSLGTWLNASGAGLKTIMAALGRKDAKSSIRYQAADIEVVRAASQQLGELREVGENPGNVSGNRKKSSL
jgi:integrase